MQAQAAIVYDAASPNSYGVNTTCSSSAGAAPTGTCAGLGIDPTIVSALKQASSSGSVATLNSDSTGAQYVIVATLKTNTGQYWCVDSSGKSESVTAATPTTLGGTLNTVCP